MNNLVTKLADIFTERFSKLLEEQLASNMSIPEFKDGAVEWTTFVIGQLACAYAFRWTLLKMHFKAIASRKCSAWLRFIGARTWEDDDIVGYVTDDE
ncbi:hypothetical protein XI09_33275 [Bradyrhizobium sp. CCBAU 11386]|uniref:hypothetical protein n=1 Tax=Bradyrhizobium sp. CCBAU 11386 TaxID=1630837 RepID=UPI002302D3D7|nr:hypothetical protein [Bradyrhizobium sp. CCBAU 11386]MDA9509425.1 hypothetical protein [Bradyrhizobium sp. CCBAU 11386]